MFCRNGRNNCVSTSTQSRRPDDVESMLSEASSTEPAHSTSHNRPSTAPVSRKSVSSACVKGHEETGSRGQEVEVAVRLAKSENGTLVSSHRPSRKTTSKNCHGRTRRHIAASSSKKRLATVTSPGAPRESPAAVTSPMETPRGRTACKRDEHGRRRTESPAMTSAGTPHENRDDSVTHWCVRFTSVPPGAPGHRCRLPYGNGGDCLPQENKKLSYRRGTARCVVSVEILPVATQPCRNYLYLSLIDPCDNIVL